VIYLIDSYAMYPSFIVFAYYCRILARSKRICRCGINKTSLQKKGQSYVLWSQDATKGMCTYFWKMWLS